MTAAPLLYDRDCGICRFTVALLLRWDRERRLRPVPLGTEEADALLAGMPKDEQMASWHLVEPAGGAGEVWSAGAAFSPLFRRLPGGTPFALLAERFPGATDRGYRWVADHRSALGRSLLPATRRWADRVISESRRVGR
jgi:predicted DCC family thiol-disulfide oxidoreductase YuxK